MEYRWDMSEIYMYIYGHIDMAIDCPILFVGEACVIEIQIWS